MKVWILSSLRKLWTTHRKWTVSLLGLLSTAVNLALLHGGALVTAQLLIGVLTQQGVVSIPNTPAPDPAPAADGQAGHGDVTTVLLAATFLLVLALVLGWAPR